MSILLSAAGVCAELLNRCPAQMGCHWVSWREGALNEAIKGRRDSIINGIRNKFLRDQSKMGSPVQQLLEQVNKPGTPQQQAHTRGSPHHSSPAEVLEALQAKPVPTSVTVHIGELMLKVLGKKCSPLSLIHHPTPYRHTHTAPAPPPQMTGMGQFFGSGLHASVCTSVPGNSDTDPAKRRSLRSLNSGKSSK